jgi:hypothetical protein
MRELSMYINVWSGLKIDMAVVEDYLVQVLL